MNNVVCSYCCYAEFFPPATSTWDSVLIVAEKEYYCCSFCKVVFDQLGVTALSTAAREHQDRKYAVTSHKAMFIQAHMLNVLQTNIRIQLDAMDNARASHITKGSTV